MHQCIWHQPDNQKVSGIMSIARDDMAAKNAPGCACILSQPPAAGPLSKCAAQFCPRTVQSRPVVFVQLDLCLRERASTKPRTNPKKPMTSISRFASLHSLNRAPPNRWSAMEAFIHCFDIRSQQPRKRIPNETSGGHSVHSSCWMPRPPPVQRISLS